MLVKRTLLFPSHWAKFLLIKKKNTGRHYGVYSVICISLQESTPFIFCLSSYQPACPSSVSVEISADGVNMLPLSTPVITSGLTYIKIQLVKAEVASAVCLRLHRPRDASNLGLSQIKLLGLTAFGNTSSATVNNPFLPSEDQVSKTR